MKDNYKGKPQKFLTEGNEAPKKQEQDVIEVVHLFANMFNDKCSKIEDTLNPKCKWSATHEFSTGIPYFILEVYFEFEAVSEYKVPKKWRRSWLLFKEAQKKGDGHDWDRFYQDVLSALFVYSWLSTGEFSLTNIAKGECSQIAVGFTGRDMIKPFSNIKDAIKEYSMTWYEREERDFMNAILKDQQDEFDRIHDLIMERSTMWCKIPDGGVIKTPPTA